MLCQVGCYFQKYAACFGGLRVESYSNEVGNVARSHWMPYFPLPENPSATALPAPFLLVCHNFPGLSESIESRAMQARIARMRLISYLCVVTEILSAKVRASITPGFATVCLLRPIPPSICTSYLVPSSICTIPGFQGLRRRRLFVLCKHTIQTGNLVQARPAPPHHRLPPHLPLPPSILPSRGSSQGCQSQQPIGAMETAP